MNSSRRVLFNPTGLPGLRSPAKRQYLNDVREGFRSSGLGLRGVRGARRVSTTTGEDNSGHISARANEGILFFDSK